MSTPCLSSKISLLSWKGASSRFVNSSPSIGVMLMVGFSAMDPPNNGISVRPCSPVRVGVAPALTRKSKVAATLATPVKVNRLVMVGPGDIDQQLL